MRHPRRRLETGPERLFRRLIYSAKTVIEDSYRETSRDHLVGDVQGMASRAVYAGIPDGRCGCGRDDGLMGNGGKTRYYVLFTQTLKQWDVTEAIRRTLPEGRGTVFYPCAELWMGSLGQTVVEPLFPGYVFIRSDLDQYEMHDFIRGRRREVLSFIKELRISERKTAGETAAVEGDGAVADLKEEEAELLDFMLGFRMEGKAVPQAGGEKETGSGGTESTGAGSSGTENAGAGSSGPDGIKAAGTPGKKVRSRKLPSCGVLGMSYGYKDRDGRYVVMEGPLKGHEDRIADVNPRDRRAYLDLEVGGRRARVGLTVRGKKYWYPGDKASPDVLGDGTVVDCREVAEAMMKGPRGAG